MKSLHPSYRAVLAVYAADPCVSNVDACRLAGLSRNTLLVYRTRLIKQGLLSSTCVLSVGGKPTWSYAPVG